jgi:superfamily II DNA/RNA helicase
VRDNPVKNAIVFCNRKRDVDVVARSLKKHGFSVSPLHGDLDQSVRTKTLDSFRSGEIRLLVASDVAARGLDIPAVSHIFNFDVPYHADDYVHRVGRTGRAGRGGHAFMLATPKDMKLVDAIEKLIGQQLGRRKLEGVEIREDSKHSRRGRSPSPVRPNGHGPMKGPSDHGNIAVHPPKIPSRPAAGGQRQRAPAKHTAPASHNHRHEHDAPDLSHLPAFLLRPVVLPPEKPAVTRKAKKIPTTAV